MFYNRGFKIPWILVKPWEYPEENAQGTPKFQCFVVFFLKINYAKSVPIIDVEQRI
jgi:hypothetical protein